MLSEQERHVMEHATAWRHKQRLFRNYFCASTGHKDWPTLQILCERGLLCVVKDPDDPYVFRGFTTFRVTAAGLAALEALDTD